MSIRELTEHDLPALLALYAHLHDSDLPLPPAPIVASVWDSIRRNDSIRYFGAFADSQLVSACNITVIPNLTRGCAPYGVIENVVTHKHYRGRGHGKAVLKAALDFAWSRQCYKVMLMTGRLDAGTFSFYEKAGFKRNEKEAFVAKPADKGFRGTAR
jgi:GNAT superfamily N-acetyltransferase